MSRYNVEKDKEESVRAMHKYLIDNNFLKNYFNAEQVYVLEKVKAEQGLEYDLDMFADCDVMIKTKVQIFTSMLGVGIKLQKNGDFRTFLLRFWKNSTGNDTEYQKLVHHVNNGYFYPQVLVHGYYDLKTGKLLSLAMAKTRLLINLMESNNRQNCIIKDGIKENDGYQSKMIYIDWLKVPNEYFLYKWCHDSKMMILNGEPKIQW